MLTGFETGIEQLRCQGIGKAAQQRMVHLTDQLGMADGECVKRTVRHHEGVIDATRLVTVIIEDASGEFQRAVGARMGGHSW